MRLTQDDVARLLHEPSADTQIDLVQKISHHYGAQEEDAFSERERALAEQIFSALIGSAETQVRKAIAHNLKNIPDANREIVLKLARDVEEVSLPVLQFSEVLTDLDLVEIIASTQDEKRHMAIAKREKVSERVTEALVETKNENVVDLVLRNEGAQLNAQTYDKIIVQHSESAKIVESMLERGTLPVTVADKLIQRVSTTIKEQLRQKYDGVFEDKHLDKLLEQSLEVATLKLMGLESNDDEINKLIRHLGDSGKISPFTALCMGNYHLLEVSLSRLARVPLHNVRILLQDKGDLGIHAIYQKAQLPEGLFQAVYTGIRAIQKLEADSPSKLKYYRYSPVQIMEKMIELSQGRNIPNMQYLLTMIQHHSKAAA